MHITLQRLNDAVHFEAKNDDGNTIHLDGSPDIGGERKGVRPMQALLMSLAGCSSMDVVSILKKMRQPLDDMRVEVIGERVDEIPAVFKKIHMQFFLKGDLDETKAKKAIGMSVEKYCSVARMLDKTAEISWGLEIEKTDQ
ncbi:MAG: OsmC family peroxiredoxin [Bacteroidetes bacterium]|nr:OsmC family peroxiredoxin [Bacteroidota bacterium]